MGIWILVRAVRSPANEEERRTSERSGERKVNLLMDYWAKMAVSNIIGEGRVLGRSY